MDKQRNSKMIGLIGGMSWESSAHYYRIINETWKEKLGGTHSAKCLLWSFDFDEIEQLQHKGDWETLTKVMISAAQALERGGADIIVICTNTMHKMAKEVQDSVSIPLLHIADPTAEAIKFNHISNVGLLGTAFTMEQSFYKGRLEEKHGLNVIVPDGNDRQIVHSIIYEELVLGKTSKKSKRLYKEIMQRLVNRGAEGIILGCTEIMLLVNQEDSAVPVFDTTEIHAIAAVRLALKETAILEPK